MDERIAKIVAKAVNDAERYPFLFVGSGLSRRYSGSPNWAGLLELVCDEVLRDRYAFARYRSLARSAVSRGEATSELPYAATLMEDDVNSRLLGSPEFEGFRGAHDEGLRAGHSPMKTYVADLIASHNMEWSAEAKLLARAGREKVSGVITTNYDRVCESLFPTFRVYAGEGELLFSEPSFAQEVYKIHGSVEGPDGLVLTEGDYAEFSSKRKYLAAKLLTIFAEYPVVFLGYSIQDQNVKAILSDVCECVPDSEYGRLHDRLVFVDHGRETRIGDHTMDLNGHMLSMARITTDDFSSVYEGLLRTERMYDPRAIRELKGNVFRLAERLDPSSEIVTAGFDSLLDRLGPGQRVAIQVAVAPASIGRPITVEDIYQDVVLDDLGVGNRFVVDNYLDTHVRRLAGGVPFYKYIVGLGDEVGKSIRHYRRELSTLDDYRNRSIRKGMESKHRRFAGSTSVAGIALACSPDSPFGLIPYLYDDEIDVRELGDLLKRTLLSTEEGSDERMTLLRDSAYRKCVRMYDFLRYAGEEG